MHRVEPVENLWKTPVDKSTSIGDCCDFWQESARRANRAQDLEFFFWAAGDTRRQCTEHRLMSTTRTIQPPSDVRDFALEMVRELGPRSAAKALGVARQTAMSIAVGAPVMPGSVALVREAMRAREVSR